MEQDIDTDDLEERKMSQQPRSRFSELEPSTDEGMPVQPECNCIVPSPARQASFEMHAADQLDDEVPGSVRADTTTVRPYGLLPPAEHTGENA